MRTPLQGRTSRAASALRPIVLATAASRARKLAFALVRWLIIAGISYVIVYPVLLMLSMAFMDPADIYDMTVVWVPRHFTLDNFRVVVSVMEYLGALANSFLLASVVAVLQVASCLLIGYGFARFRFPGRNALFALVVLTLIVPPQTIMIPIFLYFRFLDVFGILTALRGHAGILDSYWPFVLQSATGMGFKNGLYVLIFRQFFRNMPKSLEEAAIIDGAGTFRVFARVMVPNAVPAMVTVLLFSFVWQWNDEYFVSLYLENVQVLPIALNTLAARVAQLVGQTATLDPYYVTLLNSTGSLLMIAPPLVIYGVAQRSFIESIERTGLIG